MIDRYKLYCRTFLIAFWVAQCFGFVSEELLPPINALRSPVMFLCDVVILILGIVTLRINRNKEDNRVVGSFALIAVVSTLLINREGFLMLFNGMRDFLGLLFILPIMRYLLTNSKGGGRYVKMFDRQLMIYLWLQAVCVTWQFVKYGAGDNVGGTMGEGASGLVSTSIYFVSFYLMTKRWDATKSYFRNLWNNFSLVFLLYPTFLNETKISFIFLLCYFLLLIKLDKAAVRKFLLAIPALFVILAILFPVYLDVTDQDADRVLSEEFFDDYLFGGEDLERMVEIALLVQDGTIVIEASDIWSVDIPRFTKIMWLPQTLEDSKGGMIFGAGLGQFKGGQSVEMSRFAKDNQWALLGSRPWSFFVIVQLGLLGLVWYIATAYRILSYKHRSYAFSKNIKVYLTVILSLVLLYNESLRSFQFCAILFYIALYATIKIGQEEDEDLSYNHLMCNEQRQTPENIGTCTGL